MIGTVVMWALIVLGYGFMVGLCDAAARRFGFMGASFKLGPGPVLWPLVLPYILGVYVISGSEDDGAEKLGRWPGE